LPIVDFKLMKSLWISTGADAAVSPEGLCGVAEPRVLVLNRFQERLLDELLTGQPKEESMKLAILGIMVGALVVADFVAIGRIAMVIGELAKRR
jgi:hypothetical protein